jgi:capsular exopolysaccharide synthesis family protein
MSKNEHASETAALSGTGPQEACEPEPCTAADGILHDIESVRLAPEVIDRYQNQTCTSVAGEQYRLIRTRVVHHPANPRTLLISSPGTGDGKTTTAISLAFVLALRGGARTLLIDGDLRRSSVMKSLHIPARPGFADVLRGTASLAQALISCEQNPRLCILGAGINRSGATELLDTAHCQEWMETARSLFDYIVLDAPPVASVADYELLQRLADGVIIIVRPGHTERNACENALASIPPEQLLGVVVNDSREWPFWKAPHGYYLYSSGTPA